MRPIAFAFIGAFGVAACGGSRDAQIAADSASRSIQLAIADSTRPLNDVPLPQSTVPAEPPVPAPAPPRARVARANPPAPSPAPAPAAAPAPVPAPPPAPLPAARLDSGTVIGTSSTAELSSRSNKPGETFTATIGSAITAADGRVVIPAGSEVTFSIVTLKPAPNKSAKDGTIELRATSITINGQSRPIDAEVSYVEHTLKGRGVTGSEAAKVGVGAAAGAILGRVIGGGGTGTAVGGVVGGAAGAAVAVETANRDVVIAVGGRITLILRSPLISGS